MTTDFVQIVFDEKTFNTQKSYNQDYAKNVNKVLDQLKSEFNDLSEEDIVTFLSAPETLATKMENADWEEYSSYVQSLPPSVGNSMKFHCDKPDIIHRLHQQLPEPKSYFFKINVCKVENGACVVDEEALKDKCTISGSPKLLALWQKAQDAAATLTKLEEEVKKMHPDMHIMENLSMMTMGLIRNEDGKTFVADIDRLRQLL